MFGLTADLDLGGLETAQMLVDTGWVGWEVVTMNAISAAESGRNGYAVGVNHSPGTINHKTMDIGLLQLNNYWFPAEVKLQKSLGNPAADPFVKWTYKKLLTPEYNLRAARFLFLIERKRRDRWDAGYYLWNTYVNGLHEPFLPECVDFARQVGAI